MCIRDRFITSYFLPINQDLEELRHMVTGDGMAKCQQDLQRRVKNLKHQVSGTQDQIVRLLDRAIDGIAKQGSELIHAKDLQIIELQTERKHLQNQLDKWCDCRKNKATNILEFHPESREVNHSFKQSTMETLNEERSFDLSEIEGLKRNITILHQIVQQKESTITDLKISLEDYKARLQSSRKGTSPSNIVLDIQKQLDNEREQHTKLKMIQDKLLKNSEEFMLQVEEAKSSLNAITAEYEQLRAQYDQDKKIKEEQIQRLSESLKELSTAQTIDITSASQDLLKKVTQERDDLANEVEALSAKLSFLEEFQRNDREEIDRLRKKAGIADYFRERAMKFLRSIRIELGMVYKDFLGIYTQFSTLPIEKVSKDERLRLQSLLNFEKRLNDSILQFQEFIEKLEDDLF
eukprot:TRINITY_DN2608_c0_g1_i14.p1 TRINITY_DN2608_c0_g1~~TRINITY_DN2608_c0_g1_i14.p1  ORF type:complete len:407 (-),score=72.90 TRINITY_DN2608_c0_g1_i14:120-1340(-)